MKNSKEMSSCFRTGEGFVKRVSGVMIVLVLAMLLMPVTGTVSAKTRTTINLQHSGTAPYGNYYTSKYYVDGDTANVAYCIQPDYATPHSGDYIVGDTSHGYTVTLFNVTKENRYRLAPDNVNASLMQYKIVYYSYGHPGWDELKSRIPSQYREGDAAYAFCHVLSAYAVDVTGSETDGGWRTGVGQDYVNAVESAYTAVKGLPAPPAGWEAFALNIIGGQTIIGAWFQPAGYLTLVKESANSGITKGNDSYSLAGAVYTVTGSDGAVAGTLTTNASGTSNTLELDAGTYTVKETRAAKGYAIDPASYTVKVEADETTYAGASSPGSKAAVRDKPQSQTLDVLLTKNDKETGADVPLGKASLEGSEFEVQYFDGTYDSVSSAEASGEPERKWTLRTDAKGRLMMSNEYRTAGNEFYKNSAGKIALPVGTYVISEVKAPEGYTLSAEKELAVVTASGTSESLSTFRYADGSSSFAEQVKRGDYELTKIEDGTGKRMANVAFRITSDTTGESHVAVTDENGYLSTSSDWNRHSEKTNANDSAVDENGNIDADKLDSEAGIWFERDKDGNRAEKIDDALGAMPYDSYTVDELRCDGNRGFKLLKGLKVMVRRDGVTVNGGTLTDDKEAAPKIGTTLSDGSGNKTVVSGSETTIVDEVRYSGLEAGKDYMIEGTLIVKDSGEPLIENGTPVTGKGKFHADKASGTTEVTFKVDTRGLEGKELVAYEVAYELKSDGTKGSETARHEDISSAAQTVTVGLKGDRGETAPATGDGNHMKLLINAVLMLAGTLCLVLMTKRVRMKKHDI